MGALIELATFRQSREAGQQLHALRVRSARALRDGDLKKHRLLEDVVRQRVALAQREAFQPDDDGPRAA